MLALTLIALTLGQADVPTAERSGVLLPEITGVREHHAKPLSDELAELRAERQAVADRMPSVAAGVLMVALGIPAFIGGGVGVGLCWSAITSGTLTRTISIPFLVLSGVLFLGGAIFTSWGIPTLVRAWQTGSSDRAHLRELDTSIDALEQRVQQGESPER